MFCNPIRDRKGANPTSNEPQGLSWEEVARKYFNDNSPLVGTGCYKPPDRLGGDCKGAPEIFSTLVDSYEPTRPFGTKEIDEGGTLPVLGAVAHAIANASGVWIKDLPITPEKILRAVRKKKMVEKPITV